MDPPVPRLSKSARCADALTIRCSCIKLVASLHHKLTQKPLIDLQYWPFALYFLVKILFKTYA